MLGDETSGWECYTPQNSAQSVKTESNGLFLKIFLTFHIKSSFWRHTPLQKYVFGLSLPLLLIKEKKKFYILYIYIKLIIGIYLLH